LRREISGFDRRRQREQTGYSDHSRSNWQSAHDHSRFLRE
jgi:hypothetical protein